MRYLKYSSPHFLENIDKVGLRYTQFLKQVALEYEEKGYTIRIFPFSHLDRLYSELVFSKTSAEILPAYQSPIEIINSIKQCSEFIATRFHAHIFAMIARVPIRSICYSGKVTNLVRDLFLPISKTLAREDFLNNENDLSSKFSQCLLEPLSVEQIKTLALESQKSILNAITT